jgi:hypothetical protein
MEKRIVLTFLSFLILFSFVSAKISVNEPLEVYNLGDSVPLTVTLSPNNNDGWFTVELICGNRIEVLEKIIGKSFIAGEEQTRSLKIPLTSDYIGNITGDCKLRAAINDEEMETSDFKISNKVNLDAKLDGENYNPGEVALLTLTAVKENGRPLNGFLETSGFVSLSKAVVEGAVIEQIVIPDKKEAGTYDLNVFVYDKIDGERLNTANKTLKITVNQIASFIDLTSDGPDFVPGNDFRISPTIYDQSGREMTGTLELTILSAERDETKLSVKSGETTSINLPSNATAGDWRILASFKDVQAEKDFKVLEVQKVSLNLTGSLLIIENIGNSIYNQTLSVKIGDKTEQINLTIDVGETRKLNLRAPDGQYDIDVTSGSDSIKGNVFLTGDAISIKGVSNLNLMGAYPFIWTFLILILIALAFVLYKKAGRGFKVSEKKIFNRRSEIIVEKEVPMPKTISAKSLNKKMIDLNLKSSDAESSLVLEGERENATVLALKISNMSSLGENARQELEKALEFAKAQKGMLDRKENYVMVLFSPRTTKTFATEMIATRVGHSIMSYLNEYNRRYKQKMDFGIGINNGEIISSIKNGKFAYTSLGSTVILAKKIADAATSKLYVADNVRNKIIRDLRGIKVAPVGKTEVFSVEKVTDREANQHKLNDILSRMGHD